MSEPTSERAREIITFGDIINESGPGRYAGTGVRSESAKRERERRRGCIDWPQGRERERERACRLADNLPLSCRGASPLDGDDAVTAHCLMTRPGKQPQRL